MLGEKMNKGKENLKFLKKGIRSNGKYIPVRYSKGSLINYPEGTVTIYAKDSSKSLPRGLNPMNESNSQTDYFEKDRARIKPGSKFYKAVSKFL